MNRKTLTALSISFVSLVLVYFLASWYIADQSLVAKGSEIENRPEDFGLEYESVIFHPRGENEINLSGWWIPSNNISETVIFVHGLDSSKDSRLKFLAALHSEDYSILTFDLRGHGESDKIPMGAGLHEQRDVLGAIDFVIGRSPESRIGLMGVSFGAAIVILTASSAPEVSALIADSAFSSITDLISEEVSARTSAPKWVAAILQPGIIIVTKLFKGINVTAVAPGQYVSDIGFPIGIIHCIEAERVPIYHGKQIRDNSPVGSKELFVDGCDHAKAYDHDPTTYLNFVVTYFDQRLKVEN